MFAPHLTTSKPFRLLSRVCKTSIILLPVIFVYVTVSKLFTDPIQLPKKAYDFVIVGAGIARNVVAARLVSEDARCSVLLIEAGCDVAGVVETEIPFTAPPSQTYNRIVPYQRDRNLGGSTFKHRQSCFLHARLPR
ncbi:hypothetical protein OF83DRAFT_749388 [Amylostereum chailletii]|nr:hypothetical protein OF83DRAFT_749388 [Amylostereum chailletii]